MPENEWLAQQFEAHRAHLRTVAYRMLGSPSEADDAVQETWLRLSRTDASAVENLGGWLTTVVGRVCLDTLRARRSRGEEPVSEGIAVLPSDNEQVPDPEREALLGDSVGLALQIVLDTLTPAERVAFVLHDMFAVPFDEIAQIVGRSAEATRQLASRARRRVQGTSPAVQGDVLRRRRIVEAFLAASRRGDFEALLSLLDPEAVVRADAAAVMMGATQEAHGAAAVAKTFAGQARGAQLALIDGVPGLLWSKRRTPEVAFAFTIAGDKITEIWLIADRERLDHMNLEVLD